VTSVWMDGRRQVVGHGREGAEAAIVSVTLSSRGRLKGVFLVAISGSQHNTLHRPRAPAAAAADC